MNLYKRRHTGILMGGSAPHLNHCALPSRPLGGVE